MDFLQWACRALHIFAVVVWLGGLMFQNAVAHPVAEAEGDEARAALRKINIRFLAFVWMSVWTIALTGVLLMLLSPRFIWFEYHDAWSILLGLKQLVFVLMVFYAFGYARMLHYLQGPVSNGGFDKKAELYQRRLHQYRTIGIFLGILALLLTAGMRA